jgi:hypothetical protein
MQIMICSKEHTAPSLSARGRDTVTFKIEDGTQEDVAAFLGACYGVVDGKSLCFHDATHGVMYGTFNGRQALHAGHIYTDEPPAFCPGSLSVSMCM